MNCKCLNLLFSPEQFKVFEAELLHKYAEETLKYLKRLRLLCQTYVIFTFLQLTVKMSPCFSFIRFKNLEASFPNSSACPNHGITPLSRGGSLLDLKKIHNTRDNKYINIKWNWFCASFNRLICMFGTLSYWQDCTEGGDTAKHTGQ